MKTELIVALDVPTAKEALPIVDHLRPRVDWFKVGSILFTREGVPFLKALKERGCHIFLDLKFFDIPNTVKGVCEVVTELGVDMFTLHMLGGREMARAALDGISKASSPPLALGVTILTSMDEGILREDVHIADDVPTMVNHLVRMGLEVGMRGFVCSPMELAALRAWVPSDVVLVTPGVRLPGDAKGDQKRVMTPQDAHQQGANFIVMGRSVYGSTDPLGTVEEILVALQA